MNLLHFEVYYQQRANEPPWKLLKFLDHYARKLMFIITLQVMSFYSTFDQDGTNIRRRIQLFDRDVSQLGSTERFLEAMVGISFAFKPLESILFMGILQEELSSFKESFSTLEVASKDLRNIRLFLKLLEVVLKTGNHVNDGTYRGVNASKLDTLSKLAYVNGTDGKTTLLLFVVQAF